MKRLEQEEEEEVQAIWGLEQSSYQFTSSGVGTWKSGEIKSILLRSEDDEEELENCYEGTTSNNLERNLQIEATMPIHRNGWRVRSEMKSSMRLMRRRRRRTAE
jgi:hypothetical protein